MKHYLIVLAFILLLIALAYVGQEREPNKTKYIPLNHREYCFNGRAGNLK